MRIVVIGSGVTGASAAYELAREGAETVLVDAAHEGAATAAGAGIVCPWSSRVEEPLALAGAADYPRLLAALAEDGEPEVGHRRVGALLLPPPGDSEAVRKRVTARTAGDPHAGELTSLDAAAARELFPPLGHEGEFLHLSGAARLDGRLLRAALRRAARRHGLRTIEGGARIETAGARVRGVRVGGELLAADAVVAATGAWSPALLDPLDVHVHVEPQRGQIVHLRLPGTDTARWPVVLPGTGHYLLAFDDSRVVAGATREDGSGFDHRVTAGGLAEVLGQALAVAPGLACATHVETRVGFRPTGPDGLPLLGTVPSVQGLVVANGLGSGGLTAGPYAGRLAAHLALGRTPDLDLTPYDPLRR
ncbi:NAD(P)/FAD-dependent oxidoreductase [Streptomyces iconiensis]|uniref:FAD-binding oxidoreductase n=1 Tax=Streptomyces iconiensis TaxID=1384038 RepID=A0ABT6ZQ91_9ACTN|nr:FAD-binding oxidoreductase [Streptomyces iconiensis]MDJ1130693.1 FAD-binding oxidoreductase [Streptomyces iconiensis]